MAGATALVTGAAGFFGSAVVRALTREGVSVVATDRVDADELALRAGAAAELVEYVRRDVAAERLDDLVRRVEGVVHAAALTPGDEADGATGDDLLRVNLAPLAGLLRAARLSEACSRLIYVSSAGVYDQGRDDELHETDADGGSSLYGAAKLAAELVARRYGSLYGLDFAAVRPTSLFGAGERVRPSRPRVTALAQLVDHALRGEAVRVGHPDARADWLSVDDAADAVVLLWRAPLLAGGAFALSAGRTTPFSDVVAAVRSVAPLEVVDEPNAPLVDGGADRPARISNAAMRDGFGWSPGRSLEAGAADLVEELRARSETVG